MKRIFLFTFTNLSVIILLYFTINLICLYKNLYFIKNNVNYIFYIAILIGFLGSIISLFTSKFIAKKAFNLRIIKSEYNLNKNEKWILEKTSDLSKKFKIKVPEIAIYKGSPNAFAVGAFKNYSLIALSTGIMQIMNEEEIIAVLSHELAHISNGDMITLSLMKGIINTFVIFFSRFIGYIFDKVIFKNENGLGFFYLITTIILEITLGFFASIILAWFSRKREYKADLDATLVMKKKEPMINALLRLKNLKIVEIKNFQNFGIVGKIKIRSIFNTHPSISKRINAIKKN